MNPLDTTTIVRFFERAHAYRQAGEQLQEMAQNQLQVVLAPLVHPEKREAAERELLASAEQATEIAWFAQELVQEAAEQGLHSFLFTQTAAIAQNARDTIQAIIQSLEKPGHPEEEMLEFLDEAVERDPLLADPMPEQASYSGTSSIACPLFNTGTNPDTPEFHAHVHAYQALQDLCDRLTSAYHLPLGKFSGTGQLVTPQAIQFADPQAHTADPDPQTIWIDYYIGYFALRFYWGERLVHMALPNDILWVQQLRALPDRRPGIDLPASLLAGAIQTIQAVTTHFQELHQLHTQAHQSDGETQKAIRHLVNHYLDQHEPAYYARYRTQTENQAVLNQAHDLFSGFIAAHGAEYSLDMQSVLATILRRIEQLAHKISKRRIGHPHLYRNIYGEIDQAIANSIQFIQEHPPELPILWDAYRQNPAPPLARLQSACAGIEKWLHTIKTAHHIETIDASSFDGLF